MAPVSLTNIRGLLLPGLSSVTKQPTHNSIRRHMDIVRAELNDFIRKEGLDIAIDVSIDYAQDAVTVLARYKGNLFKLEQFITRWDIDDSYLLKSDYCVSKFCHALNLNYHFPKDINDAVELKPAFSLSELEQAQAIIDECKAS